MSCFPPRGRHQDLLCVAGRFLNVFVSFPCLFQTVFSSPSILIGVFLASFVCDRLFELRFIDESKMRAPIKKASFFNLGQNSLTNKKKRFASARKYGIKECFPSVHICFWQISSIFLPTNGFPTSSAIRI